MNVRTNACLFVYKYQPETNNIEPGGCRIRHQPSLYCDSWQRITLYMTDGQRNDHRLRYNSVEEEDEEEEEPEGPTLESQFVAFVKHANPDDPGTHIALSQIDFWMKQAGVIQIRKLTKTDTGICYFHFRKYKLDFDEFKEFLLLLSNRKKIPEEDIVEKLIKCGPPTSEEDMKKR